MMCFITGPSSIRGWEKGKDEGEEVYGVFAMILLDSAEMVISILFARALHSVHSYVCWEFPAYVPRPARFPPFRISMLASTPLLGLGENGKEKIAKNPTTTQKK